MMMTSGHLNVYCLINHYEYQDFSAYCKFHLNVPKTNLTNTKVILHFILYDNKKIHNFK